MPTGYGRVKKITCTVCGKSYTPETGNSLDGCPYHQPPSAFERIQLRVNQYVKQLLQRIRS